MNKLHINVIALALGFAFSAGAWAQCISKGDYEAATNSSALEFKSPTACRYSVHGNPTDICIAEAEVQTMKTSDANAAANEESAEARTEANNLAAAAKIAKAARLDALYEVTKELCNSRTGGAKDCCLEQIKRGFGRS